jgi:putative transposase
VTVDFENNVINLSKIKGVPTTFHRTFEGMIKTVTISRTPCGHYYVSVLVDESQYAVAPVVQEITPEKTLGIDLGLTHFLIDSDSIKVLSETLFEIILINTGYKMDLMPQILPDL